MKNTECLNQNPYQVSVVFEARDKNSNNVSFYPFMRYFQFWMISSMME